tara:strand:+ start:4576 stop:6231 length:1656 start_codon:yes stop_codon:yes gene_type:complete
MSGTLRLRGSTSGYAELQAAAVAGDQTFILPAVGGTLLTTDSPIGNLTLELGSASQPSLRFEGDTDTGLFSSGANTLNLVTGGSNKLVLGATAHTIYSGTNGSVRALDIDSNGYVGIGGTTMTDDNLLNIQGSSATKNIGVVLNDTNTSKIYGIQNGGSNFKIFDYTASQNRFTITSTGAAEFGGTGKFDGHVAIGEAVVSDNQLRVTSDSVYNIVAYSNRSGGAETDHNFTGINDSGITSFITKGGSATFKSVVDVTSATYTYIGRRSSDNTATFAATDAGYVNIGPVSGNNSNIILDGTNGNATFAGKVSIGTTTSDEILHVAAASETVSSRDGVLFQSTSALAADTGLPLVFTSHIGTQANYGVASIAGRKENATSGQAGGYLQFATGNAAGSITESMRLTSSKQLWVNTTTNTHNYNLIVNGPTKTSWFTCDSTGGTVDASAASTLTINGFNPTFVQVYIKVNFAANGALQAHFDYELITCDAQGSGGTTAIRQSLNESTGSFQVSTSDFAVTKSGQNITITYTNQNAGQNQISYYVKGLFNSLTLS